VDDGNTRGLLLFDPGDENLILDLSQTDGVDVDDSKGMGHCVLELSSEFNSKKLENEVQILLTEAQAGQQTGDYVQAIEKYRAALKIDSSLKSEVKKELDNCLSYVKRKDDEAMSLIEKGKIHRKDGKISEAIQDFQRAIEVGIMRKNSAKKEIELCLNQSMRETETFLNIFKEAKAKYMLYKQSSSPEVLNEAIQKYTEAKQGFEKLKDSDGVDVDGNILDVRNDMAAAFLDLAMAQKDEVMKKEKLLSALNFFEDTKRLHFAHPKRNALNLCNDLTFYYYFALAFREYGEMEHADEKIAAFQQAITLIKNVLQRCSQLPNLKKEMQFLAASCYYSSFLEQFESNGKADPKLVDETIRAFQAFYSTEQDTFNSAKACNIVGDLMCEKESFGDAVIYYKKALQVLRWVENLDDLDENISCANIIAKLQFALMQSEKT